VLLGILGGLTNKKIGENLGLSEGSVKTAVQQLFQRAGVRRRASLCARLWRVRWDRRTGVPALLRTCSSSAQRQPNG